MTEHKNIQNPNDYDEDDYREFESLLFSPYTRVEKLEDICMTLAHLPTKRAQELLAKFKKSDRAKEVDWLECAVDEGQYHYLSPQNEEEERDYLALKVMQEIEDSIIELEGELNEHQHHLSKKIIEHEATKELVASGELPEEETAGFDDFRLSMEAKMEELTRQIFVKNKVFKQIKKSIKTERYKNIDTMYMRNVQFF